MAISDYNSLAAAIKTYCARNSSSAFTNSIELFVVMAEQRFWNGSGADVNDPLYCEPLNAPELETTATVTMTDGLGDLPTDISSLRAVRRAGDDVGLDYLTPQRWAAKDAEPQTSGDPAWYTIEGSTLKVTPSYTGSMSVLYFKRDTPLTSVTATNSILDKYPMLYFQSCLFEAFSFLQDTEAAMGHFARYRAMVAGINSSASSVRFGGARLKIRTRQGMP